MFKWIKNLIFGDNTPEKYDICPKCKLQYLNEKGHCNYCGHNIEAPTNPAPSALSEHPKQERSACPICGFHYAFDGVSCKHCGFPTGDPLKTVPTVSSSDKAKYFKIPDRLWKPSELLVTPLQDLRLEQNGVYGWYFDVPLPGIPDKNYIQYDGWTLLYVGIAEDEGLIDRLRIQHLKGNAFGSTLRRSIGCLLSDQLQLRLYRHGKATHFGKNGERILSDWLIQHAQVAWLTDESSVCTETAIFNAYGQLLPLNIKDNPNNKFRSTLKEIRRRMKRAALDSHEDSECTDSIEIEGETYSQETGWWLNTRTGYAPHDNILRRLMAIEKHRSGHAEDDED